MSQIPRHQLSWQPPAQWRYNCNVDAGVHADPRKTSAGWCVRDYRGLLCWEETLGYMGVVLQMRERH
jgi:hypothetical protein